MDLSEGIDVSNHQRGLDWNAVENAGYRFAYIKATEGIGYVDPLVDQHLDGLRSTSLYGGLYHYARPDTNAPEADAEHFGEQLLARQAALPGSLPPCLDIEQNAPVDMVQWSQRFIDRLRQVVAYGPVLVYASTSWWNNQLADGGWLDDQTWAWVAHYGREPGSPGFRNDKTVMHQYTSGGQLPGYDGDLDLNLAWVDLATLAQGGDTGPIEQPRSEAPPWPLPGEHYYGLITGPAESHGGYYDAERPQVRLIQEALQRKGFAPSAHGWADGLFEGPTRKAVLAWQRSVGYHQTGNIWPDDWALLLS